MSREKFSRRTFIVASTSALAGGELIGNTFPALAQTGIRTHDIPDLTIKEVKVYHTKYGSIDSIVTNGGVEGNYSLMPNAWVTQTDGSEWLNYAKRACVGKSALDLEKITSQFVAPKRRMGQSPYAADINNCLWDIIGKSMGLPLYKVLGAYQERLLGYASSGHRKTVENFVNLAVNCKNSGFKALKIHPPRVPSYSVPSYRGSGSIQWGSDNIQDMGSDYKFDIEIVKAVREAVGDDFILILDSVGVYSRFEALKVGRVLDELNFYHFEDALPTTDIDGYVELRQMLDTPLHVGEFMRSIYDYIEFIRRDAVDALGVIETAIGGVSSVMKIGRLAELSGMECRPHNFTGIYERAVALNCGLAMPNCIFCEFMQGEWDNTKATTVLSVAPFMKDTSILAEDGYVYAPTKPGLGYEIDYDKLEGMLTSVDR